MTYGSIMMEHAAYETKRRFPDCEYLVRNQEGELVEDVAEYVCQICETYKNGKFRVLCVEYIEWPNSGQRITIDARWLKYPFSE